MPDDYIIKNVRNCTKAMTNTTKVMIKYDKMGLVDMVLSVTKLDVLGIIELRFIQFKPDKNNTDSKETSSMLITLLTESS
jgi:hypothetical protein